MRTDDFETEACKQILLYPKNIREAQYRKFKLNINPTERIKCFGCRYLWICKMFSNFNTSLCRCGRLKNEEISFLEDEQFEDDVNGIFLRDKASFIITDYLRLTVDSTSSLLKTLEDLGCADVSKLREQVLDIGLKEVMTLLQCVFSSNTPLTDTFLKNKSSQNVRKIYTRLSPCLEKKGDEAGQEKVLITFDAIVRKQDMKLLYVECCEDFVDLLFTFLAMPLDSTWELSGNNITLGCVENLCRSFKDLNANERTTSKCMLPYYYRCQKKLLNIKTPTPRIYSSYSYYSGLSFYESFSLTTKRSISSRRMTFVDPKSDYCDRSKDGKGFVKRDTKFTVSDDLIVTPKNSSSSFSVLKKFQIHTDDLEVQVITISNGEALNLLRASLVTSSALSTACRSLIVWKSKEENVSWNPISKKPKKLRLEEHTKVERILSH